MCGNKKLRFKKSIDIYGNSTPRIEYIVLCEKCGNFLKPQSNAFIAAYLWNKSVSNPSLFFRNLKKIKRQDWSAFTNISKGDKVYWFHEKNKNGGSRQVLEGVVKKIRNKE